jgi:hypothetical protein
MWHNVLTKKLRRFVNQHKHSGVLNLLLLQLFISPKGGPTFLGFFYTVTIYSMSFFPVAHKLRPRFLINKKKQKND